MIQSLLVNKQVDPIGDYIQKKFLDFLETFMVSNRSEDYRLLEEEEDNLDMQDIEQFVQIYILQAEKIRIRLGQTMFVNLEHFFEFDRNFELRDFVLNEFTRFESFLNRAVGDLMKKVAFEWAKNKNFYVAFYNVPDLNYLRELRTSKIGKLIVICGTVTRTSEVKPELLEGSFFCKMCRTMVKGVDQQFRYTEPRLCSNSLCSNRTKWELSQEDSTYADWQKLRLQENPSDIPPGSMPRSIDVIMRNELTEACKPGDKCKFSGILLVVPDVVSLIKPGEKVQHQLKKEQVRKEEQKSLDGVSGLKNLGTRDLTYKLIFVAHSVIFPDKDIKNPLEIVNMVAKQDSRTGRRVVEADNFLSDQQKRKILEMKSEPHIYQKLSKCIAPGVYGHEDVKKGILLMLLGGVNKNTSEGIKLRGDLNICIVGDPSTAKSQFLKYVCQLLPRAVYTSGKGSSAAGLTASVVRDVETGEFCIEAGAIMLADNSICCIDEFDKMDQKDQVAIHEAMEQQTISIAKAGIQATLMARTSILAAANPTYGRYDTTKSLRYNIDISAPIMSRFDLFFVVVDERDDYSDFQIAQHIIELHRQSDDENLDNENSSEITQKDFLMYITKGKQMNPQFTKEAAEKLREEYQSLRQGDISYQKTAYRITVRQLESLIRLSEALARAHLDEFIHPTYVTEAAKLLRKSIVHVDMPNIQLDGDFERNLQEDRKKQMQGEDVIMVDCEEDVQRKKMVISGAEYEKWKTRIVLLIRELESEENIKVRHKDIIEFILQENFSNADDQNALAELAEKLNGIIERLINKDGILIVTSDEEDRAERILSVNVNYGVPNL